MGAAGLSRRTVVSALVGGGALLVGGCSRGEDGPPAPPRELRVRARIAEEVSGLTELYAGVLERFPDAASELSTLAAEHSAHVEALLGPPAARRLLRRAGSATAPPSGSPSPSAPPEVPATLAAARLMLADSEAAASRRRAAQARTATPGTARLLASIGACNAVHAALLRAD